MHRDSEPDLVFEDMTVMSDFELHCLCREEQVQCKRTLLLIIVSQKRKGNCVFLIVSFQCMAWYMGVSLQRHKRYFARPIELWRRR